MSTIEQTVISAVMLLAEAWFSFYYYKAFLVLHVRWDKCSSRPLQRKGYLPAVIWTVIYFAPNITLFVLLDNRHPLYTAGWFFLRAVMLFILMIVFFYKEMNKGIFLLVSFLSGVYMLRFLITALYSVLSGILLIFWEWEAARLSDSMDLENWKIIVYGTSTLLFMLISGLYIVLLAVYLRLLKNSFLRKDMPITKRQTVLLSMPNLTAVTVAMFIRAVILQEADGPILFYTHPSSKILVPVMCLLMLASIVAAVKLLQAEFEYRVLQEQQAFVSAQIRQMKQEVAEVNNLYDTMRGLKHDLRGHIANITAYVRGGGLEKETSGNKNALDEYILEMEKTFEKIALPYQTGNPITDVILSRWSAEAKKRGVTFEADFTFTEKNVDAYDMAVILNNSLENAIDAAGKAADAGGEGYVRLRSFRKAFLFFIETENDYTGEILMDAESGLPRPSDTQKTGEHGIGLGNIRRQAEKYLGTIDIDLNQTAGKRVFTLTVMLNTGEQQ